METDSDSKDNLSTEVHSDGDGEIENRVAIGDETIKTSDSAPDHGKENKPQESENSAPCVTNFSISEILKPSFGVKCQTTRENKSKDSEQTHDTMYLVNSPVDAVKNTQQMTNEYGQSQSLLFNFRCLNNIDLHVRSVVDKMCMSPTHDSRCTDTTPRTTQQNNVHPVRYFPIHSNSQKENGRFTKPSNKLSMSSGKTEGRPISGTAVTSSNTVTTSTSPEQGPRLPSLWPAWVYCTRYSDRPSSDIQIRVSNRLDRNEMPSYSMSPRDPKGLLRVSKNRPRSRKVTPREKLPDEKRPRTAFTNEQLLRLRSEFEASRYLTEQRRKELARSLDLSESQIKIWYQNKRAKIKKASGSAMSSLAIHLMAQGLYNHKTCISETRRDC